MCGIVGALSFQNSSFAICDCYIAKMRDAMQHRGPDGAGVWVSHDHRVGLGHRRLSIIDLSTAANQPMSNEDGTIQLVFNGEIYNHAEIRTELERVGGHRWKTDHSDTEVIIHAFEQWGIECIERFRGMFAFGLWDGRRRELWLVRDRIGIKPLYYSVHHGRISFASEIKALLKDPEQPRVLNEEALFHYLSFLTTPAPETLFQGIKKLPGGTLLRVTEDGELRERRYWDLRQNVCGFEIGMSESDLSAAIMRELRTSVGLRKISDVPVGVFLSGGIDSSTNAALFSEDATGTVKTFSIGYEGEYHTYQNELHYARRVAQQIGAQHHERLLTQKDLLDFLPDMVRLQDEPIADPVCVPIYYVSKLARENGVTVAQVGEGADELFWGYPGWKLLLQMQQYTDKLPSIGTRAAMIALRLIGKERSFYYEWLRRSSDGVPVFWGGAEAFAEAQKTALFSPRLKEKFRGRTSWEALASIRSRYENNFENDNPLDWMTFLDLNLRLPELLLMRVDKMSMGVSLEARVPFLDHKFVELAMSIPATTKTRGGELKRVLKHAVRGTIPDEIVDRKKQGFGVPVYEWFFDELGTECRRHLDYFIRETDLIDRAEVDRLFDSNRGPQLWYLLNLALWWKEYIQ